MAVEIKMPALSPTMETGTLATWNVAVGDEVRSGDVIAEIETDKATMEVEAVEEGVIASILIAAGSENVAVGTVIARLAEDGEDVTSVAAAPRQPAPKTNQPDPAPHSAPASNPEPAPVSAPETPAPAATASSIQPAASASVGSSGGAGRIFASPLARRIAADHNLDLAALAGSGPHGRILRADVEAAVTAPAVAPASMGAPAAIGMVAAPGSSELVANSQMRKVIAERLQQSKQTAPHFYLTVDCEIDQLLASRRQLNALAGDGVKISVNDLVIRAAAQALIQVPEANASWEGDHTRRFAHADISMAVAIEGGLITPVIWAAEQKGLAELSQISRDLAERARAGSLAPEEFTGGSFTISNLGMFGVREFAAVINPPQGAILAVGAGEERPIVRDGALAVATVMTVTLSCDHRAVDGAVGARWLQSFKSFIENPVTMLL
jgi:pyruvate dehydrogenase E2 component (dihydrolipoamide acetyltransferase)